MEIMINARLNCLICSQMQKSERKLNASGVCSDVLWAQASFINCVITWRGVEVKITLDNVRWRSSSSSSEEDMAFPCSLPGIPIRTLNDKKGGAEVNLKLSRLNLWTRIADFQLKIEVLGRQLLQFRLPTSLNMLRLFSHLNLWILIFKRCELFPINYSQITSPFPFWASSQFFSAHSIMQDIPIA